MVQRNTYHPLIETEYMAAILITVEIINFGKVCLAIGEESIYVLNKVKRIVHE
jgi:hypothetical protein